MGSRVWGDTSGGGENWGESMCKTVTDSIVNSNFADECAFEDVCAYSLTAYQLLTLMSVRFLTSFFGDW